MITSDFGLSTSQQLIEQARAQAEQGNLNFQSLTNELKQIIKKSLASEQPTALTPNKVNGAPKVIVIVGVNGVGKTTTIGKLASRFKNQGAEVMVGAGDTFRAAAVEQLKIWGERANVQVISAEENAKPSTVAYKSIHAAIDSGVDVLLLDTAGRLHTRTNLMNELKAIFDLINRELPGAPHEVILVLDATTGQNALQQAKEFNQVGNLSGVIMTKLDGTPKGGILVSVRNEIDVPIRYIGVGEQQADLKEFNVDDFVDALFDIETDDLNIDVDEVSSTEEVSIAKPRARRRRREAKPA